MEKQQAHYEKYEFLGKSRLKIQGIGFEKCEFLEDLWQIDNLSKKISRFWKTPDLQNIEFLTIMLGKYK